MENSDVSAVAYLINSIGMFFALFLFFGVMFKFAMITSAIAAYPVYLALYAFEFFTQSIRKNVERKFFKLNLPEDNPKRFFMNTSASLVMLFMLPNFFKLYSIIRYGYGNEIEAANKFTELFFGTDASQLWFNGLAGIFILLVYVISYLTKVDERDPLEKIEKLSVPSLWSGIFKKVT